MPAGRWSDTEFRAWATRRRTAGRDESSAFPRDHPLKQGTAAAEAASTPSQTSQPREPSRQLRSRLWYPASLGPASQPTTAQERRSYPPKTLWISFGRGPITGKAKTATAILPRGEFFRRKSTAFKLVKRIQIADVQFCRSQRRNRHRQCNAGTDSPVVAIRCSTRRRRETHQEPTSRSRRLRPAPYLTRHCSVVPSIATSSVGERCWKATSIVGEEGTRLRS